MDTQIATKKIDVLVHKKVIEVMREILSDPDYGLDFNSDFIKRLRRSIHSKKSGKVVGLDSVFKKYKV